MPLGNPTDRFSANKEWFSLRTNSLLISKARPTHQWIPVLCTQSPRSETTGQGWPSAQDVLWRGFFTHPFSLCSGAVFSPRRCPWFPWGCSRLSQGGVVPSFTCSHAQQKQPSQADVGHQPFPCLSPHAQTWSRWRRSPCKAWIVLPLPGPGLNVSQCCLQCFTENQIQLVLLDLSFPRRVKVVSLLPCWCSERTLKHLQPE